MKKAFIAFLVLLALLACLGAWAMIDGMAGYRHRPMLGEYASPGAGQTQT